MIRLSIIIVHYKTFALTQRCLANLSLEKDWEVIIVDNDSQDGAQEKIKEEFPHIQWISNPSNEGFGRANNLGVQNAKGEYILLINSDMLVSKETIQRCLDFFDTRPDTGVLGCKLLNEDKSLQKSTYGYIGENKEIWQYNLLADKVMNFDTSMKIRAVMGSFFMMKKSDFNEIGGFDSDYFMYCEELDLCDRVSKELKKDIVYYDEVEAIHKHGGSSEGNWSARQTWLSRALLVYKRKGLIYYLSFHCVMLLTILTNFFIGWKVGKEYKQDWKKTVHAYRANCLKYFQIPFKYSRNKGSGKNLLKASPQ